MDESSKAILNDRQCMIQDMLEGQPQVSITYFKPDSKKSGGAYITITGGVKKIDEYERSIVMQDATKIPIDEIISIDGEMFSLIQ